MATSDFHSKQTGNAAIHPATYVGSSDPASPDSTVTADNKLWIDTTTGTDFASGWQLKIRSGGNVAWTSILNLLSTLGNYIAKSLFTTKGDLVVGGIAGVPQRQGVGADGTVLVADSTQGTGVKWSATGGGPTGAAGGDLSGTYPNPTVAKANGNSVPATVAKGDLLQGSAASTLSKLTVGSDGTFLVAASGQTTGAQWRAIVENDVGASTNAAGNTSTAITINWSTARTQSVTATGNFTLTHSNMVAGLVYTLEVATGAGSFTASFASTSWAGGTAPTLTVTASKTDVFTFYKTIGGTILGGIFGQAF